MRGGTRRGMVPQALRHAGMRTLIGIKRHAVLTASLNTLAEEHGSTMKHELVDQRCTRVLAREYFLLGALQAEVQALYLEFEPGRWYRFRVAARDDGWTGGWLVEPPSARSAGDDAEARHPLVDVAAHFGRTPSRIEAVTSRRVGELAELSIEFHDGSHLVAHYRPPPGSSSLVWVTH